MCVVSFIGDDFRKRTEQDDLWKKFLNPITPNQQYNPEPLGKPTTNPGTGNIDLGLATKAEVEILRREVEQLKELLKGAIEYDKRNNEPHCEIDEKVALLKKIAEAFGIDLTDIFENKTKQNDNA
jgi:hypothetical protein